MSDEYNKSMYLVVSQSGSIVSKILKVVTRAPYNHVSISLNKSLKPMYSFARVRPYNPVIGGYVAESANRGTLKRFPDTKVIVLEIRLTEHQFTVIKHKLRKMLKERKRYRYNYLGLFLAAINVPYKGHNRYYCSEFVKEVLVDNQVEGYTELDGIIKPIHFLGYPHAKVIYHGRLNDYTA
ncbi:MAG: hypothetical protein IKR27_00195 [Lachnospiraceae bacterium]|nr:hypothetical protein [Lachnospiraceae bacterium]